MNTDWTQLHQEWPIKEDMRNIGLEKELEKGMKMREGCIDKDIKHKDKVYRYSEKDNKHKGETNRKREDKYHEGGNRSYKHKEDRYWDDVEWEYRHKTGWARGDINRKKRSREHTSEFEYENLKDGSHRHTYNLGGRPNYDDQVADRHKDNKDVKRDNVKDEISDYRSHSIQDQHLKLMRYMKSPKIDPNSERGMSSPHNDDMEITANHSQQRSSLNWKYCSSRDHHRVSKHEETAPEKRSRHTFSSNQDLSDKVCIDGSSAKKHLKSDSQMSPSSTNKLLSPLPPLPPFKAGSDSLLGFGTSEDDRSKINDRNWKPVDHDFGRSQSNWNHFSIWPYMPFHHVPPTFNPFMYQSLPRVLGGPPINMNYATMPNHFTGDRFRNWDHGRTELNGPSWESNMVSVDLQSVVQKNEDSVHGHTDEIRSGQTDTHIENEENKLDFNTPEVMKVTESSHVSLVKKDNDALVPQVYLSKIYVSKDLTRPELYDQCTNMLLDLDQASSGSDECDCKILFTEEGVEEDISSSASLFAAVDDSVFKKAMSLYKKQKEPITGLDSRSVEDHEKENVEVDHPVENQEKESCAPSVGECEVKLEIKDSCNNYDGRKEVDKPSDGGSFLVLTNLSTSHLTDLGLVHLSRIHSAPESTH